MVIVEIDFYENDFQNTILLNNVRKFLLWLCIEGQED